jgi:hypothetical protein
MRESRTSGSVRGARDNPRPYRYHFSRTKKHDNAKHGQGLAERRVMASPAG